MKREGWMGQEQAKGKNKVSPRRGEGYESITGFLSELEDDWFLGADANLMLLETCVPTGQTALAHSLSFLLSG